MKKHSVLFLVLILILVCTGIASAADTLQLNVQKAVQLTLQNNPQLQQALAQRDQMAAQVGQAEAGNWPTVNLTDTFVPLAYMSNSYSLSSNSSANASLSGNAGITNSLGLQVQYPLFAGGAITYGIKQAKTGLQMADWGVQLAKQQLQNGANQYYYYALYEKNMVVVQKSALDTAVEHLRVVTAQYNAGVVAKTDVLRTQVEVANAQENLIHEQNNYQLAILQLNSFMNIPLDTNIVLTEDLSYTQKPLNAGDLSKYALQNRPDYLNTLLAVQADNYAVKVSQAAYYPTIGLQASYSNALGYNQYDTQFKTYTMSLNSNANSVGVGAQLTYNIFSGFLTDNQVKAAQAQVNVDTQKEIQSKLSVIYSVNQSVDNIVADVKLIETAKANLDFANENYKINCLNCAYAKNRK